jgi:small subunit ribosomal protein S21
MANRFPPTKPKYNGTVRSKGQSVVVEHDNIEKALRLFKRKCTEAGTILEVRDRQNFTKPTTKRKQAKAAAKMRTKREMQKNDLNKKRLY